MKRWAGSLQQRVVLAFGALSLFICALFVLLSLAMMYTVEDSFFERMLAEEAERLAAEPGAKPLRNFVSLHASPASFPADLAPAFAEHPGRLEFAGQQGRHYHLQPVPAGWLVAEVSSQLQVRPQREAVLWSLGQLCALLCLCSLAIGWWLARQATLPLARLDRALREAEPGQAAAIDAASYPDNEIGRLAESLQQAWQRNQAFAEREQAFGRDASHELRTPLAVIANAAELMQARGGLPAHAEAPLARIREASHHMALTVRSLLSLSGDAPLPAPREFDLRALVEQALAQHPALTQVEIDLPSSLILQGQPDALSVIVSNLLGNAAQHAPGSLVCLDWLDGELRVSDQGPGFADGPSASAGFGLGLAIVQRLCERYGVGLRIASGPMGSTVALRL